MKKEKVKAPKSLKWRKYLKVGIWVLVVFWTLGSLRGFSLAAKVNEKANDDDLKPYAEIQKTNFATEEGAQTFAHNFLKEYLTWNKDNYQNRADRLKTYLRQGIDEQAGLRFDSLSGNSSPEKIELWEVSDLGFEEIDGQERGLAELTFKTTHSVTTITEAKDKNGKVTKKEAKQGPFEKWIKVTVITDGNGYLINEIPTFTSSPAAAQIGPKEVDKKTTNVDPETTAKIKEFLNTFFKQYSTGTKEELEYLTTDKDLYPLGGALVFTEVEEIAFIENKEITDKDHYSINVKAIFTDNNSKAQALQQFKLEVKKENDRWQVIKFN